MSKDESYIYFKLLPITLSVWLRDKKVFLKPPDFEDVCSELYLMYKNEEVFIDVENMALLFSMFYIRIPKALKKLKDENILVENIDDVQNKEQVIEAISKHNYILTQISDEEMELLRQAYLYKENMEILANRYNTSTSSMYGKLEKLKRKLKKLLDCN
jgi:hypothetical protein